MTRQLGLTRIVIVEDHTLFAESLDIALTLEGHDVRRVSPGEGGPTTSMTILAATLHHRPRVALIDLALGATASGVRLIEPLQRAGVSVVVITGCADRLVWGECLRAGASAVLSKSEPLNVTLAAIRHLREGRCVMSREERERLMSASAQDRSELHEVRHRLASLTPRERQVLVHLMHGRSVREIAGTSVVSEATVRTQVKSILAKLHVSSQLAAVSLAHRGGLPVIEVVA
ncbi:response regulator transcription factor [Nocardioides sp. C4-1]|uniref:response regulator transcription factor n=1 Tax=Nocardioides sp. C4-1 TaxID=3151851 RepID=UPI003266A116